MKTHFILLLLAGITLFSCKKEEDRSAPRLETSDFSNITTYGATCGGYNLEGENILDKGLCWAEGKLPETSDNKISAGTGNSAFSFTLADLKPGTTYFVRAYATNKYRTGYGSVRTVTTERPPFSMMKVEEITTNSARFGVALNLPGGSNALGLCIATHPAPTVLDRTVAGYIYGSYYNATLTSLSPNTVYYLRAYSVSNSRIDYSEEISFKTYYGSVTDYNGTTYFTIKIGNKEWMSENLRAYSFSNGTNLMYPNGSASSWMNTLSPALCFYQNNNQYVDNGYMYNWYTVSDVKNIAPVGWHVSNDNDWQDLFNTLGGKEQAGFKLKDTLSWLGDNSTNASGFSAYATGWRNSTGLFEGLNTQASFWVKGANPKYILLEAGKPAVTEVPTNVLTLAIGIRCVKD